MIYFPFSRRDVKKWILTQPLHNFTLMSGVHFVNSQNNLWESFKHLPLQRKTRRKWNINTITQYWRAFLRKGPRWRPSIYLLCPRHRPDSLDRRLFLQSSRGGEKKKERGIEAIYFPSVITNPPRLVISAAQDRCIVPPSVLCPAPSPETLQGLYRTPDISSLKPNSFASSFSCTLKNTSISLVKKEYSQSLGKAVISPI